MRKRISREVTSVVGNSGFILNFHLDHGYFPGAKNREVIFSAYTPNALPSTGNIPKDRALRLGYLGQLAPNKGLDRLLACVRKLPRDEYQLWVGGKGNESHVHCLKTRYRAPNIYFLGFVAPDRFFQHIDVLVVPSLWNDPLPRNIFEAYSNGVPVIGSNRGGIPEIIDIGTTGFIFDPDHSDMLLSLLAKIKHTPDLLAQMRRNCFIKSQEFLPEPSLSKYLDIYRKEIHLNTHGIH
jgi:glycosyltransferase involved in cell wall biosynthesis